MKFKTLLIGIATIAMAACSETDDPVAPTITPTPEPEPEPEPVEITITLDDTSIRLPLGESRQLVFSVDPEGTSVKWESSDQKVVMVDKTGRVMGLSLGTATVTARSGEAEASCEVSVTRPAAVGDFYYSDGTWSTDLNKTDPTKIVIGVIFWLGDPTANDAALRADHPECVNGLVVATHPDMSPVAWQANQEGYNKIAGTWVEQNTDYASPTTTWGVDTRRNMILGYNNTKALEAFNADPANAQWPITVVEKVQAYRRNMPAPATSSGWFLPSLKELTLLMNSEHDGDVYDFNNVAADLRLKNRNVINYRLSLISGAQTIGSTTWDYDIWASNDMDNLNALAISSNEGSIGGKWKDNNNNQVLRCVLAF